MCAYHRPLKGPLAFFTIATGVSLPTLKDTMAGLQVNLYAGIGVTWIAALATLIMRVIARRVTRVDWWFDDYFAISAFVRASPFHLPKSIC